MKGGSIVLNLLRTISFLCLGWAAFALAGPSRDEVMALLRGYEWDISADRFAALDGEPWSLLMEIARDDALPDYIRGRARAALTLYPNQQVWQFYRQQLGTETGGGRRRVVDAICEAFVEVRGAGVENVMKPLLRADDAHLRSRAAICLERIDSETAQRAVQQYRQGIAEPWERQMISGGES